ncbi:hypothetical protein COL154_013049 [Colletotrichum chrysophilum]|uniref:uncharacterized protein n=1 Tax=Colletotrichum chrysophilum TaxID=1836956 RepID=UPI002300444C|nr:uncharacterized protein COL26b_014173 [Colletotrichum chrysophilum]KAJ0338185.1 hypothetical protein KNSL1_012534 [Colletotrichum chrysophilum]KAJ0351166.1 hypothetical protein COL154_013049 [Colletotrichum chrysophilum]KAJ0360113.1 hypothetical protein COL26b_014173 [Colletotrichum chrysophilum]
MHPRQRIETEPGVREPLSALRQLASIYSNSPANPLEAPRTFRALHNAWWHHARLLYQAQSGQASSSTADPGLDVRQWHRFLRNQLSQDELETVAKLVFHDDGVWARGQQGESGRRLQALKSNMGQQYEEMLMLLPGADIPRSWNAIKNINSLLKARDPTKRKSLDAVLDAITAAAIDRHELGEKPESTPPELLPVDIETAFRDLRPGEEPGSASRRSTPAVSRSGTPASDPSNYDTPPPPPSNYGTPLEHPLQHGSSARAEPPELRPRSSPLASVLAGRLSSHAPRVASALARPLKRHLNPDAAYQPPSKRARATTTTPDAAKPSVETDDEEEAENARGRSNDVAPDVEELGPILDDSPIARFKGKQPALPEPLSALPGPIPND